MTKLRFLTTAMASVALAALTATPALAQDAPNWGRHMWQGGQVGYFFFGHLMMVGTIVLSVAAVILLVRWLSPGHGHYRYRHGGPSALAILEERFARGEIDKAEFDERRRALRD